MSRLDLERFAAQIERDPALADAFAALGDDAGSWVRLARQQGYDFTLEEARELAASRRPLSDYELEQVAGGWDGDGGTGGGSGDDGSGSGGGGGG